MANFFYQIDQFVWELSFDASELSIGKAFHKYFSEFQVEAPTSPSTFIIRIFPDKTPMDELTAGNLKHYSLSGNLGFSESIIARSHPHLTYAVIDLFNMQQPTVLNLSFKIKNRPFYRAAGSAILFDSQYVTAEMLKTEAVMNYGLFWWVFAFTLQKKSLAYFHASTLRYDNRGVVLAGTSGCGKTSISLKMLEMLPDCTSVIDDFCTTTHNGILLPNPKPFTLYQSDVKWGYRILTDFVSARLKGHDKWLWHLGVIRGRNPRRRVHRRDLLPEQLLCNSVACTDVFFLARANIPEPTIETIDQAEMVERIAAAAFREFSAFYDILENIHAVGYYGTIYPSIDTLEDRHRLFYKQAFQNANFRLVHLPLNISPERVIDLMFG